MAINLIILVALQVSYLNGQALSILSAKLTKGAATREKRGKPWYNVQKFKMTRCAMMIRVMYSDGRFDMVKPNTLDNLISQQAVTSFKRDSGWAVVGRDKIRSSSRGSYHGKDRRLM